MGARLARHATEAAHAPAAADEDVPHSSVATVGGAAPALLGRDGNNVVAPKRPHVRRALVAEERGERARERRDGGRAGCDVENQSRRAATTASTVGRSATADCPPGGRAAGGRSSEQSHTYRDARPCERELAQHRPHLGGMIEREERDARARAQGAG